MIVRALLAGAVAGTISALAFTVVHGLLITSIWFMLMPMLIAGALCGLFLGWSYILLANKPTVAGWFRYNGLYLILLLLLGPISLLVFEPIISIPALLASPDGLPVEIMRELAPLATIYTVVISLIITLLYGRRWSAFFAVLVTTAVLILLLGLNIAPMGLVFLTGSWLSMLLELMALILTLDLVYALAFAALGHDWLWKSQSRMFFT
ncbi:MAG: hypothetical protein ACK2UK_03320 [Candidatus Promineifilaceae bacterium]